MPTQTESEPRRFLHNCRSCRQDFRVLIQVEMHVVHMATCPRCGAKNYFDNRSGVLDRARQQAPGRENAKSAEPPTQVKRHVEAQRGTRTPEQSVSQGRNEPASTGSRQSIQTRQGSENPALDPIRPARDRHATGKPANVIRDYRSSKEPAPAPPISEYTSETPTEHRGSILERARNFTHGLFSKLAPANDAPIRGYYRDFRRRIEPITSLGSHLPMRRRLLRYGIALGIMGFSCFLLLIVTLQLPWLYLSAAPDEYLQRMETISANRIVDRNNELIGELFQKKTGTLTEETLPETLAAKLIFVEDEGFYDHGGVDWYAVSRAAVTNVFSLGYSQGGSTLTQQMARILLNRRDKNMGRKLRETSLAYYLEDNLTKRQILTGYLNHVYLGHGAVGVQTAAQFYFDKPVEELSFVEELVLVCLPSAPEYYSPLRRPSKLKIKMDNVFERMEDDDFPGAPTREEYEREALAIFRGMNKSPRAGVFGNRINEAPYVAEHVRLFIKEVLGEDYQYDADLTIETTIDRVLQRAARDESDDFISRTAPNFPPVRMEDGKVIYNNSEAERLRREYQQVDIGPLLFGLPPVSTEQHTIQTASIGIRNGTGEVLFMQGGTRFGSGNQLNRVVQMRRQTGSSIKPIVYSAGIESGAVTVASLLEDKPIFVSQRGNSDPNKPDYWMPDNYSGVYEGQIPVRLALAKSQNIPAIQVARRTGMDRVSEQFRKFFFPDENVFRSRFRSDETVAIGSLEMSPIEMAVAYSAFTNNGDIRRPFLVRRIVDRDGKVLYEAGTRDEFGMHIPETRSVLSPSMAEIMISLLKDSARYGGIARGGYGGPAIGKTGTSNDHRDAWFVGSTPTVTAAVWVGFDDQRFSMNGGTGSNLAGPLWGRIVKRGNNGGGFSVQGSRVSRVLICPDSGRLATANCPKKVREIFLHDHKPGEPCDLHADQGPASGDRADWSIDSGSDFE